MVGDLNRQPVQFAGVGDEVQTAYGIQIFLVEPSRVHGEPVRKPNAINPISSSGHTDGPSRREDGQAQHQRPRRHAVPERGGQDGAADHVAGEPHQSAHGATKDRGKGRQQGDRQGKRGQQQTGQARVEVVPIPRFTTFHERGAPGHHQQQESGDGDTLDVASTVVAGKVGDAVERGGSAGQPSGVDRAKNASGGGPNQGPNDPGPVDQHAVWQFVGVDLGHHSGQGQSKGDAPKSADDAEPQSQENLGAEHLATGCAHRTKHGQLTLTF